MNIIIYDEDGNSYSVDGNKLIGDSKMLKALYEFNMQNKGKKTLDQEVIMDISPKELKAYIYFINTGKLSEDMTLDELYELAKFIGSDRLLTAIEYQSEIVDNLPKKDRIYDLYNSIDETMRQYIYTDKDLDEIDDERKAQADIIIKHLRNMFIELGIPFIDKVKDTLRYEMINNIVNKRAFRDFEEKYRKGIYHISLRDIINLLSIEDIKKLNNADDESVLQLLKRKIEEYEINQDRSRRQSNLLSRRGISRSSPKSRDDL